MKKRFTEEQIIGFLREDLARAGIELTVIDVASREFDERRFNVSPYRGHPSAAGNEVIARVLLERWPGPEWRQWCA